MLDHEWLGKVGNDDAGRNLFKANRTAYLQGLQAHKFITFDQFNNFTVNFKINVSIFS